MHRNGDARVPDSCKVDGYDLGAWVWGQRRNHAKGVLDPDRERRLKALLGWTWNPRADQWDEGFRRLQDYIERNGNALVPATSMIDGYRLGRCVNHQRARRAKGSLDADYQRRLQNLPGWTWDARDYIDRWEDGFNRLLKYVELNGDARVPSIYTVDNYRLGRWVVTQRAKRANGTLMVDRERRLQELPGWTWNTRSST